MDFHERLEKAIQRGRRTSDARAKARAERELNEKELARLHSEYRLDVSDRIERCLRQVADQFPGFRIETLYGEKGWGAAASRDDIRVHSGRRDNLFSRLEMVIRPPNEYHVLELAAKATVGNREVFNRSQYQRLTEVDLTTFHEMVDNWSLEFAEIYAAKG
jgi:hypothetical protein